jgi:hypothetical protein
VQHSLCAACHSFQLKHPHPHPVCDHCCRRRLSSPDAPAKRIKFLRGLAEATDFDDGTFDLVVFSFVIHECPQVGVCWWVKRGGGEATDFVDGALTLWVKGGGACEATDIDDGAFDLVGEEGGRAACEPPRGGGGGGGRGGLVGGWG